MNEIKKNISYSLLANIVSIIASVAMVLFMPKYMSLEDFGMWQLFLFYLSYSGFFHFGWVDGMYLRYAGSSYEEFDKPKISGQIYALFIFECFVMLVGNIVCYNFIDNIKIAILKDTLIILPIIILNLSCNYILQIGNKIKEFAKITFLDRLSLIAFILFALFFERNSFNCMYYSKVASVIFTCIFTIFTCKTIFFNTLYSTKDIILEAKENLKTGIRLLIANLAGMLIIGFVRYGISVEWSVSVFGKISLTLSICNFLLTFINALSIAIFPFIKKLDLNMMREVYVNIRVFLTIIALGGFCFYYPLKNIIELWLPKYADSLEYMLILFPVCLYASRTSLLVNTYFKSLRKEILLEKINLCLLGFSVILTFLCVFILKDLCLTLASITFIYFINNVVSEFFIQKMLGINLSKEYCIESIAVLMFFVINKLYNNYYSVFAYGVVYLGIIWYYKIKIMESINNRNKITL